MAVFTSWADFQNVWKAIYESKFLHENTNLGYFDDNVGNPVKRSIHNHSAHLQIPAVAEVNERKSKKEKEQKVTRKNARIGKGSDSDEKIKTSI